MHIKHTHKTRICENKTYNGQKKLAISRRLNKIKIIDLI